MTNSPLSLNCSEANNNLPSSGQVKLNKTGISNISDSLNRSLNFGDENEDNDYDEKLSFREAGMVNAEQYAYLQQKEQALSKRDNKNFESKIWARLNDLKKSSDKQEEKEKNPLIVPSKVDIRPG